MQVCLLTVYLFMLTKLATYHKTFNRSKTKSAVTVRVCCCMETCRQLVATEQSPQRLTVNFINNLPASRNGEIYGVRTQQSSIGRIRRIFFWPNLIKLCCDKFSDRLGRNKPSNRQQKPISSAAAVLPSLAFAAVRAISVCSCLLSTC